MLFKAPVLAAIAEGKVDLAFRRWRKPTVKAGGTLTTPVGVLAIDEIVVVAPDAIDDADAVRAGYASAAFIASFALSVSMDLRLATVLA